jgi:transcriptional regulator with XRE-family HTH domain
MEYERVATCSERIKTALSVRGMRQADLCKLTHIPKSALSQYISGAYEPKQDRIYLISKALNVSEAWLMGLDVPIERQERKKTSPSDKVELTEGERLLLNLFRQIPEEQQQVFLEMGRVYANSLKKD